MKWAVVIISPHGYIHSSCFREIADTIVAGFHNLGIDCDLSIGTCVPGRQNLILGTNLIPFHSIDIPNDSILYNLEQVQNNTNWLSESMINILKRYRIWDYSKSNEVELNRLGIKVERILPIGYSKVLEKMNHNTIKDIDAIFVGSMNERRRIALERIQAKGLKVVHLFGIYGQQRDDMLVRAKILLNLYFYEAKVLEVARISYYLANRCAVLSEHSANKDDDIIFYGGVEFSNYDELPDRAEMLCNDIAKQRFLSSEGYRIMSKLRIEDFLEPILNSYL